MDVVTRNVLWRKVVGDVGLAIPGVNSHVVYRPRLHFRQSDGAANVNDPKFPETVHATVKSVNLEFSEGLGYPFVNFLLSPRADEEVNEEGGALNNIFMEGMDGAAYTSFDKEYTYTNKGGTCQLKKIEASLFGKDPGISIVFVDGSVHPFAMKNGKISGQWQTFLGCKGMEFGDKLVFMKRQDGEEVFLGMKRGVAHAGSGQMIVKAMGLAEQGICYRVYYFPHVDRLTCVDLEN